MDKRPNEPMMWTNEKNSAFRFSLTFCGIKHLISGRYKSVPVFTNDTSNLFSFHNFQHTHSDSSTMNERWCFCTLHEYCGRQSVRMAVGFWWWMHSVHSHKMASGFLNGGYPCESNTKCQKPAEKRPKNERKRFVEPQNFSDALIQSATSQSIHNNWSHVNEAKFSH